LNTTWINIALKLSLPGKKRSIRRARNILIPCTTTYYRSYDE
jgi:hypothetical protein